MTKPLTLPETLDSNRLPEGQAEWVRAILDGYEELIGELKPQEHALYGALWKYLARHHAPATSRHFPQIHTNPHVVRLGIDSLSLRKLLWFDDDLRAVLQCPPFSALHTYHQVKAFGWERIYVTSFLDIPLTLLIYGPNVWIEAQSSCPRSGDLLTFRVKMREDYTLTTDAPPEADDWQVWLPLPDGPTEDAYVQFHRLRAKINAFSTLEDLATHRQYHPTDPPGGVYTFEQSIYLSNLLLLSYAKVLEP
jgi:hypothetical protein